MEMKRVTVMVGNGDEQDKTQLTHLEPLGIVGVEILERIEAGDRIGTSWMLTGDVEVQDGGLGVDHEGLLAKLAAVGGGIGVGLGLGGLALLVGLALLLLVALAGGLGLLDVRSLTHDDGWSCLLFCAGRGVGNFDFECNARVRRNEQMRGLICKQSNSSTPRFCSQGRAGANELDDDWRWMERRSEGRETKRRPIMPKMI